MKDFILDRLREPSTWRASIWLVTSFGVAHFSQDQASALVALAMSLSGGVGVVTPDKLFNPGDRNK